MDKCLICSEYKIWSNHTCKPCYYVWPDWEDFYNIYEVKSYKVFAQDAETAAIKYAEKDWEFPDGEKLNVVSVKNIDEILERNESDEFSEEIIKLILEKSSIFELESEAIRSFYATKVSR